MRLHGLRIYLVLLCRRCLQAKYQWNLEHGTVNVKQSSRVRVNVKLKQHIPRIFLFLNAIKFHGMGHFRRQISRNDLCSFTK